jgi:hypothetical protein
VTYDVLAPQLALCAVPVPVRCAVISNKHSTLRCVAHSQRRVRNGYIMSRSYVNEETRESHIKGIARCVIEPVVQRVDLSRYSRLHPGNGRIWDRAQVLQDVHPAREHVRYVELHTRSWLPRRCPLQGPEGTICRIEDAPDSRE